MTKAMEHQRPAAPASRAEPEGSPTVSGRTHDARRWLGLAVLALPALLLSIDVSVLYLARPSISRSLHASPAARRPRNSHRTEASKPASSGSSRSTYFQSRRARTASATCRSDSPSANWAPAADPHTPEDAARVVPWDSPRQPGGWTAVVRRFRDGHRETWWAADLRLAGMAPEKALRLVAVTTDPARLPADSTWYLLTNLPHPDAPHAATSPIAPADLAEVARLYGLRMWVEIVCSQDAAGEPRLSGPVLDG